MTQKQKRNAHSSWQPQSVTSEVKYIVSRAARREGRIVTLGPLVFFSMETGDAWVLVPEDALALCLARDGDAIPAAIVETAERFAIPWNARYQIEGSLMIFTETSGRQRAVVGYPTREIEQAIQRMRS